MYAVVKILFVFSYFTAIKSEGITCVQCTPTRENRGRGILPCSEFDWSPKYIVECPKSTLCFKRTYTIPLGKGQEIRSVERGCAPQTQERQTYNREERKWYRSEVVVESVYKEGCSAGEDNGRPGPPAEYCFCSSWSCNKSSNFREISSSLIALHVAGMLLCIWGKSSSL